MSFRFSLSFLAATDFYFFPYSMEINQQTIKTCCSYVIITVNIKSVLKIMQNNRTTDTHTLHTTPKWMETKWYLEHQEKHIKISKKSTLFAFLATLITLQVLHAEQNELIKYDTL